MLPKAAIPVKAEPEIAPIIPQTTTQMQPRAPLTLPTKMRARSTNFSAMLLSAIRLPAIMNMGTAISDVDIICE